MKNKIKIVVWLVAFAVVSLGSAFECRAALAAPDSVAFSLFFRQGDDMLLRDYKGNNESLSQIDILLRESAQDYVPAICVIGSASPEGNEALNNELAYNRAVAVRGYILWKYPHIMQESIRITTTTDNISDWMRAIEHDLNVPRRDKVLEILQTDASLTTKWANIQLLVGGAAEYIERHIFPSLRNAISCVIVLNGKPAEQTAAVTTTTQVADNDDITEITEVVSQEPEKTTVKQNTEPQSELQTVGLAGDTYFVSKPLFAVKTNLLFDAATLLNVELEVPIGKRWSVAGELIFPWWLWEGKQNCLQVMSGNVEGRYWFGNRNTKPNGKPRAVMTGWFAGLYAGGGYYDLEWDRTGYQGEFFIAAGISGGYVHTINKSGSLRMEYSLGVGYMQTNYRKYEAKFMTDGEWHLYRQSDGRYTWFGPTRAHVSLVWMIGTNRKGGTK